MTVEMPRVWSLCSFWNELDVLECRFREQREVVDVFVVSEAPWTYAGTPKPLNLLSSLLYDERDGGRWSSALGGRELRVVTADDPPEGYGPTQGTGDPDRWRRENWQRKCLERGLIGNGNWNPFDQTSNATLERDDLVCLSDCDEILRPSAFRDYITADHQLVCRPHLPMHVGSANLRWPNALPVIARLCRGKTLLPPTPAETYWGGYPTGLDPEQLRWAATFDWPLESWPVYAENGWDVGRYGWHLSYLGGPQRIVEKLREAAHPEMNRPELLDPDYHEATVNQGRDVFGRENRACLWVPDQALPDSIGPEHRTPCPKGWKQHEQYGGAWGPA